MTLGQDCLFGIPSAAVQALVDGRHGDPFSILGPHQCGSMSVVRVLAPGAQKTGPPLPDPAGFTPGRRRKIHLLRVFCKRLYGYSILIRS
jgi:hypothetical protein